MVKFFHHDCFVWDNEHRKTLKLSHKCLREHLFALKYSHSQLPSHSWSWQKKRGEKTTIVDALLCVLSFLSLFCIFRERKFFSLISTMSFNHQQTRLSSLINSLYSQAFSFSAFSSSSIVFYLLYFSQQQKMWLF